VTGQVKSVRQLGQVRLKKFSSIMNSLFPSLESLRKGNSWSQCEQITVKYHSPVSRDSFDFILMPSVSFITPRGRLCYQEKTGLDQDKPEAERKNRRSTRLATPAQSGCKL
jgi:hypothetical protein